MRLYLALMLLACPAIVSGCSPTEPKPTVRNVYQKTTLPPVARKSYPLTVKPDKDLPQYDVLNMWSADRTARNLTEISRRACVAAVDAENMKAP
jgi:hypothetical protein